MDLRVFSQKMAPMLSVYLWACGPHQSDRTLTTDSSSSDGGAVDAAAGDVSRVDAAVADAAATDAGDVLSDSGTDGFDAGVEPDVLVPLPRNESELVLAQFPSQMTCGETANVFITMRNQGTTTWTRETHKLGAVDDQDDLFGPDPRVYLPVDVVVVPGDSHTFGFSLVAPAAAGSFHTDWRMVHEGVEWFGPIAGTTVEVACEDSSQVRPLPDQSDLVDALAAERPDLLASSCVEEGGNNEFLHELVRRLRLTDTRWGYNWKRGNVGDLSQDVVDYHWGEGPSEGSTDVYIIDVIVGHCGPSPAPGWTDVTQATLEGGTVGKWTGLGRF